MKAFVANITAVRVWCLTRLAFCLVRQCGVYCKPAPRPSPRGSGAIPILSCHAIDNLSSIHHLPLRTFHHGYSRTHEQLTHPAPFRKHSSDHIPRQAKHTGCPTEERARHSTDPRWGGGSNSDQGEVTISGGGCPETGRNTGEGKQETPTRGSVYPTSGRQILEPRYQINLRTRRRCFRGLVKICGEYGVLPNSYIIPESKIKKLGDAPVSSGSFSKVWPGVYDGDKVVAIKILQHRRSRKVEGTEKMKEVRYFDLFSSSCSSLTICRTFAERS